MNQKSEILSTGRILILLIFLFSFFKIEAQEKGSYTFIYVDISKSIRKSELQDELDKIYNAVKEQKYIYYLSNHSKPFIGNNQNTYGKLQNAISNLSTSLPEIESDKKYITEIFNSNDFLQISKDQENNIFLTKKYDKVTFHFFVNPGLYYSMNLKKFLVEYFLNLNSESSLSKGIEVFIHFDENLYRALDKKGKDYIADSPYKILKY